MRRSLGFKLEGYDASLYDFVDFLKKQHTSRITAKLMVEWVRRNPSTNARYQNRRFCIVRGFSCYHSAIDPRTEVPPSDLVPGGRGNSRFYLYTDDEIRRILAATLKHPIAETNISGWVRYTLYGLLSVAGLRVGEALRLDLKDVDLTQGILTIRNSKFGSSRLVPLRPSTCTALKKYLQRRNDYLKGRVVDAFFVTRNGTRLSRNGAWRSFVRLSTRIGLRGPKDRHGPRLHDFRHCAAVQVILQCYRSGADPERCLPVLSTYLGHTNVNHTYWYLHQNPALMKQTVARLERYWKRTT